MNEQEARRVVERALAGIDSHLDLAPVSDDERFRDALDLDSMDFLNLVDSLHSLAHVDVPEADYPQIETIGGLLRYLVAHTA